MSISGQPEPYASAPALYHTVIYFPDPAPSDSVIYHILNDKKICHTCAKFKNSVNHQPPYIYLVKRPPVEKILNAKHCFYLYVILRILAADYGPFLELFENIDGLRGEKRKVNSSGS